MNQEDQSLSRAIQQAAHKDSRQQIIKSPSNRSARFSLPHSRDREKLLAAARCHTEQLLKEPSVAGNRKATADTESLGSSTTGQLWHLL